jgi:hypothetical protein
MAAVLAFIPLTHSVFWGTLAYTLIGGTFAGTVLTLVFLPAMYSIWFKIRPGSAADVRESGSDSGEERRRSSEPRLRDVLDAPN